MIKKLFFLILIFSIWNKNSTSAQIFENNELTISKLEDQVCVIETADNTTMYLIEGRKKAMLIDTGTKCENLDSIIAKITKKPLYVVITHAHPDHDGNIQYFKEIYLHPADTVLFDRNYKGKVHFVTDGDVFDLGGKKIEVVWTPAHTPGSIVLVDKKAGLCFSGDAFGSGQVWLQLRPHAPISTYITSCLKLEKLMDKGITKIYCGHYPYVKKAYDKEYLVSMRKLAEALNNGTAPEGKPYPVKVSIGCDNPMIVSEGLVSIVYDPENIR